MNLEKVFNFIKDRRGYNIPFVYKLIKGLPLTEDELNVMDDLNLYGAEITSLPDNFKVLGSLDLSDCKMIKSLPDNLKVGGSLYLMNTNITTLPDNFKVGGYLGLSNTKIKSLPDNLTVEGSLNLSNTKIKSIPNNLKVDGSLNMYNTPLSKKYTQEQIRNMIEEKGGYFDGMIFT